VPRQTFQHSSVTPAQADAVWKALDQPATWESIPGVDRVIDPIVDGSGRLVGFSFESMVGGKAYRGEASTAGREEEKMMAWDIRTSELKGRVTVALSAYGEGTRVYVRVDIEGVGMLGSVFFPVIASAVGNGFHETVNEFVRVLGG
jgi:carbon monoxide dehydrogenase subunit G